VVMVGENCGDFETAEIAIRAGHDGARGVSRRCTPNDAVGGITVCSIWASSRSLLASVVRAFLAQRLVRTICHECASLFAIPKKILRELGTPHGSDAGPCTAAKRLRRALPPDGVSRACCDLRNLRADGAVASFGGEEGHGQEMKSRAVGDGMGTSSNGRLAPRLCEARRPSKKCCVSRRPTI